MSKLMKLNLKVWRQKNADSAGKFEEYKVDASPDMSFLEMFDVLNEQLIRDGEDPITFDHDCREGICGACSMYINGKPHGLTEHYEYKGNLKTKRTKELVELNTSTKIRKT